MATGATTQRFQNRRFPDAGARPRAGSVAQSPFAARRRIAHDPGWAPEAGRCPDRKPDRQHMQAVQLRPVRPVAAPFAVTAFKPTPCRCSSGACCSGRRQLVASGAAVLLSTLGLRKPLAQAAQEAPADIRLDLAPDQGSYDAGDERLREAANALQGALNAEDVAAEEATWTEIIAKYKDVDAPWRADIVGRAYGNRGNARSRQGKLQEALDDFNEAIAIVPWSADPVLNRGVVYEAMGRFDEAVRDYKAILRASPLDPSAWNNLGNASMGLARWDEAAECYGRAARLAPSFSFAAANRALALYQLGRITEAVREMRALLRRYPDFPDMRAALAAAQWEAGNVGDAESNWARVEDPRYADREWLASLRRWPPRLRADLEALLDVKAVSAS